MDIDMIEEENGCMLQFNDGDISNIVFLDKLSRYKLLQLLIEQQIKDI